MKINRPMWTENTRPLLLSLIIMTALSLVPMLSHGAVFWDDEMEQGNTSFSEAYMLSTLIPQGTMSYDTSVKFSGNGSVRLNYPSNCQATASSGQQCGGSITKTFTPTDNVYKRAYFRMSGSGPNATGSGLFETYTSAYTKSFKGESTQSPTANNYARLWWGIGWNGGKNWSVTIERTPVPTSARNLYSSINLQDNQWYCIETHEQMNTPDVADGIIETWVDGVLVLRSTNINYRNSGTDSGALWKEFSVIRQGGAGNIWYDRFAAGDTRIGCLGAGTSDITPPTPPQGLVIR